MTDAAGVPDRHGPAVDRDHADGDRSDRRDLTVSHERDPEAVLGDGASGSRGDADAGVDDLAGLGLELRLACQRIARRIRYESAAAVAPHQFTVLARLEDGDLAPGELADLERVSAPSMTRTVNALVEQGLVRRTKHPTDGRVVLVGLSPEGVALLDQTRHRRDLWMTSRLNQLDPRDVALVPDVARILSRIAGL